MNEVLHTKFGKAKRYDNHDGYYIIISRKEGNDKRKLHHLIWEDFYGCKIPKGYHIHHKNGNKLDNCILNLQLIKASEHAKLHGNNQRGENNPNYGNPTNYTHSKETREKMSKARTKHYARIIKDGSCGGKQRYGLMVGKKRIKSNISIEKLIDFFHSNYPNEYLEIP